MEDPKRSKIQRDRRSKEIEDPKRSKIQRDRRSKDPKIKIRYIDHRNGPKTKTREASRQYKSIITQAIALLSKLTTEAPPVDVDDDEPKKTFLMMATHTTMTNTATKTIRRIPFIPLSPH